MGPNKRASSSNKKSQSGSKLRCVKREFADSPQQVTNERLSTCKPCSVLLDSSEVSRYFQSRVKVEDAPKVKQEDPSSNSTRVFLGPSIKCNDPVTHVDLQASASSKEQQSLLPQLKIEVDVESSDLDCTVSPAEEQESNLESITVNSLPEIVSTPSNSKEINNFNSNTESLSSCITNVKQNVSISLVNATVSPEENLVDPLDCVEILNHKDPPERNTNPINVLLNSKFSNEECTQSKSSRIVSGKLESEYVCTVCSNKFHDLNTLVKHPCFDKDNGSGICFQFGSKKVYFRKVVPTSSTSDQVLSTEESNNFEIIEIPNNNTNPDVHESHIDQSTDDESLNSPVVPSDSVTPAENDVNIPKCNTENDVAMLSNSKEPDMLSESVPLETQSLDQITVKIVKSQDSNASINTTKTSKVVAIYPIYSMTVSNNSQSAIKDKSEDDSVKSSNTINKFTQTQCKYCAKIFSKKGINQHIRLHVKNNVICKACKVKFSAITRYSVLVSHQNSCSKLANVPEYSCKKCSQKFIIFQSFFKHKCVAELLYNSESTSNNLNNIASTLNVPENEISTVNNDNLVDNSESTLPQIPSPVSICKPNNVNTKNSSDIVPKLQVVKPDFLFGPRKENTSITEDETLNVMSKTADPLKSQIMLDMQTDTINMEKRVDLIDVIKQEPPEIVYDDKMSEQGNENCMGPSEICTPNFEESSNKIVETHSESAELFHIETEELIIKDEPMTSDSEILQETHSTEEYDKIKFKCLHCNINFDSLNNLRSHLITEKYCTICKISFTTFNETEMHLETVHTFLETSEVNENTSNITDMIKKIPSGNSESDDSDEEISNKLTIDVGDNIENSDTDDASEQSEKSELKKLEFNCSHCNVNFEDRTQLRLHLLEVRYCIICKIYFPTTGETKSHSATVHKSKLYACSYCKLEFPIFSSLQKHIKNNRCIVEENCCRFCKLQLNSRKEFEKHIVQFHANKTKCPFCNVVMKRRVHKHYHRHTLFRPCFIECPGCDLKFESCKTLAIHKNMSGHRSKT